MGLPLLIKKDETSILKTASIVGGLTLVSRILGYVRDMMIASFLGATIYADAFIVAFRIPNLARRLFGEGSLSVLFVPVFSQYLSNGDRAQAFALAQAALRLLTVFLTITVILGVLLAPLIVNLMAPGFERFPEKLALTIDLTRIMLPYLLFVSLVALSMALLNSLNHFTAPALAPSLLNLVMIAALLTGALFGSERNVQVILLAFGVVLGGGCQLLLQLPFLWRCGIGFQWFGALLHPGLKKIGWLVFPTIFGSAVYQINILVGTMLASQLPEGSISYLYYADRLIQFPLGIFAVAMGTAILPSLSRQAACQDLKQLRSTFVDALCLIFFLTIPATIGLIVLREPIVMLLFQRGAFDVRTSQLTADALLYYGIGLWAYAAIRVLLPTFYALQAPWIPVKSGIVSICINIGAGILLMPQMGHCGLALATALAAMANFGLLTISLRQRIGAFGGKQILVSLSKNLLGASLMGGLVAGLHAWDWGDWNSGPMLPLGRLGVHIAIGVGSFALMAKILKMREINMLLAILKKVRK